MSFEFSIGRIQVGGQNPFVLISGPCQIEGLDHSLRLAERISTAARRTGTSFIFKGSYDKANRTSMTTPRGIGMDEGLRILQEVSREFDCPVLTDVHEATHCDMVADVCDVLQIPAFLCRQTDLLIAAGKTRAAVNIKKGQFLDPHSMRHAADKILSTGNSRIMLCERGTSFGYNTLINDFRALPIMAETGYPVIFDATHSVQMPGKEGNASGGDRRYVAPLARAAVAVGTSGLFIEAHDDPDNAPSDGPNMINIRDLEALLNSLKAIETAKRQHDHG